MFKDVKLYALVWVWACMYGRACGLTGSQRFGDLVLIVDDDMDAHAHGPSQPKTLNTMYIGVRCCF